MSKTQENLLKAFAGESMARNKYTFFAKQARKENLEWIARVFEETADNERAHAEEEYEHMKDKVEMTNTYDIHAIGNTLDNLKAAAAGEKYEWGTMYPEFEKTATEEGESLTATLFKEVAEIEEQHEQRYNTLAEKLASGDFFETNDDQTEWKCLNCGYVHKGKSAPTTCPACLKPQGWYMQLGLIH